MSWNITKWTASSLIEGKGLHWVTSRLLFLRARIGHHETCKSRTGKSILWYRDINHSNIDRVFYIVYRLNVGLNCLICCDSYLQLIAIIIFAINVCIYNHASPCMSIVICPEDSLLIFSLSSSICSNILHAAVGILDGWWNEYYIQKIKNSYYVQGD